MSAALRQPAWGALRHLATRGFAWWTGELRGLVPPALARRLASPVRGERRLRLSAAEVLHCPPGLPPGAAIVVALDPALVFEAMLDLPAAAAASLPDIVRHQIGLLVPLDPAELAWSHAIAGRDPAAGTIRVAVAIVRQRTLDAAQAAARPAGLLIRRVEGAGPSGRIHAFGDAAATAASHPRGHRILEGIAALCLLVAIGLRVLAVPAGPDAGDLAQLRREAGAVAALRQTVDRLAEPVALLRARIATSVPLQVLEDLTRLLPDDVWISGLRLQGDVLEISGSAPAAATLIGLFEAAPRFAEPAFRAALTNTAAGRESFELTVRVRPAP